ncbi:YncE family protein [Streptomyces kronopolitis]
MNTDVPRQLTPEDPTPPVNPRIPAGTGPFAMATEPSGKLYIANTGSNDVTVIDSSDNTVTTTVPAGTGPSAVAVAPNGNVYVTNTGSNDVTVIDSSDNTVTTTLAAGTGPYAVKVAPNGNVYVTNFASNDVSVFLPTATHAAGVAPPADGDSEQQAP